MTNKIIKQGQSNFTLSTTKPIAWSNSATITCDVIGLNGTVLTADNAVTVYAGGVTASDADAGEYDVVLSVDNAVLAGARVAIGTTATGFQERVVDGYVSATKTITLTTCLDEDVATGASVIGLDMSTVIDASADAYANIKKVSVRWKPDGDDITMTEIWRVLSVASQPSGLEYAFKSAYPTIANTIEDEDFEQSANRAEQWLVNYCDTRGRDYKLVVNNDLTKELVINKMALMIGTAADISTEMYERISKQFEDNLTMFDSLPVWVDKDEDGAIDEGETESVEGSRSVSRGL
jgi:hypothetical protein